MVACRATGGDGVPAPGSRQARPRSGAEAGGLAPGDEERPPEQYLYLEDDLSDRFLRPQICDPLLVVADLLIAGIVAPTLLVFFLVLGGFYTPAWLAGDVTLRRGLLAPALEHGAGLALCWLPGALAGRAYESAAVNPRALGEALRRTWSAGAVASGLLLIAGQVQVRLEGLVPDTFGTCTMDDISCLEADAVVLQRLFDVLLDIVAEALVLTAWRLARAGAGRPPPPPAPPAGGGRWLA